nr:hypothetical protein [uncultured Flavobacterium sp.]
MKTTYLFPYRYKLVSGIIFGISLLLFSLTHSDEEYLPVKLYSKVFAIVAYKDMFGPTGWFIWTENDIIDEILFAFTIVSGLVFAFSKEKTEDEMVASIRLNSLVRATVINYLILLFLYLTVYDSPFLNVLNAAMFSQLLIFIILFRVSMYRFNKSARYEE